MATTWEISRIEFRVMLRLFQDTVDLTKSKDSHQLLEIVILEPHIYYIAKHLVKMEKVET